MNISNYKEISILPILVCDVKERLQCAVNKGSLYCEVWKRLTYLFLSVPKFGEIVNAVEDSAFVSNACVKIVLFPILIHAQTFKNQPFRESGLQRSNLKDRVHMQLSRPHRRQVLLHPSSHDSASATENCPCIQETPKVYSEEHLLMWRQKLMR